MTGKTHAAAGAFIGAVIGQLTGSPLEGFFLGMFAGLLPDIDHPRSTLGRKRKSLSFAVNAIAGHRGITHTVWFCLVAAVGIALLTALAGPILYAVFPRPDLLEIMESVLQAGVSWPTPLVLGLIIFLGSLSHLLLDGITISGIELFYPVRLPARLAWLEYPKGIIKTGNELIELPLSFLLLVLGYLILVA